MGHKGRKRPEVRYDTPGRECAHADKGCCPRCMGAEGTKRIPQFRMKMPKGIRRVLKHN
jgi:hypothetical protein